MKRLTETEKWRDPWFQGLSSEGKLLWLWLCDRVDNAGVIDICWPVCNAETGGRYNDQEMGSFGDRVEKLPTGKWLLPKFVKFQFGKLSDSPNNKVHCSVVKLLDKHGLSDRLSHSTKDKNKDKEKDKDKDIETFSYSQDFCLFWDIYPRRISKGAAYKAWQRLKPGAETVDAIMAAVKEQSTSPGWVKDGGQFIPHPATWLNQRRWEDTLKVNLPEKKANTYVATDEELAWYEKEKARIKKEFGGDQ